MMINYCDENKINFIKIIQTCLKQGLNPCKVLGEIASGNSNVFAFQNV